MRKSVRAPAILDAMTNAKPAVAVLGPGRLGRTLAAALEGAGYRVRLASSRTVQEAQDAADTSDVAFLTVPDAAIAGVAAVVEWRPGQLVAHCSGARGLEVLAVADQAGALIGCLHPLQSFPPDPDPARFTGITCGIEGPAPADAILAGIAADLGARTVRLEGVDRALYHAAAVLIANDAVALAAAATRATREFGYTRMWSIHPAQIRPILDALAPDARDIETASAIILAAEAVDWAPISHAGQLHDRASYRFFWQLLERAHDTGRPLPSEVRKYFSHH